MIVAGESMVDRLSDTYSSPACKLSRMVEKGEIIRLRRGLYETDPGTPPYLVANCICEPSYISFEYALSWHSIIPERVNAVTNATYGKRRSKVFETPLGTFRYYDIPHAVFEMRVRRFEQGGREFFMATAEKAVCDKLFKMPPTKSFRGLEALMFEDLRFDEEEMFGLDLNDIASFSRLYRCTTINTLRDYLEEHERTAN